MEEIRNECELKERGKMPTSRIAWASTLYFSLCILALLLRIAISSDYKDLNNPEELKNFLADSSLEYITSGNSLESPPVFQADWKLHRFRNICVRNGADGICTGPHGLKILANAKEPNKIIDFKTWQTDTYAIGPQYLAYELKTKHPDGRYVNNSITYLRNTTFFLNCARQRLNSTNPSHLIMKYGQLFEFANYVSDKLNRGVKLFNNPISFPFNHLFLHQCSNPSLINWEWGQLVEDLVTMKMKKAGLFRDQYTAVHRKGFNKEDSHKREFVCFDEMILSGREWIWLEKPDLLIRFRSDAAFKVGEPVDAIRSIEKPFEPFVRVKTKMPYCKSALDPSKSSARIIIFQRSGVKALRSFINLNDVIRLAQGYTTIPVVIARFNSSEKIKQQIRLFNSFDILIGPHGSHMSNGIFTTNPAEKAVIEVSPFVFDSSFHHNYIYTMGFRAYLMSTGHTTPNVDSHPNKRACSFQTPNDFHKLKCNKASVVSGTGLQHDWIMCDKRYHTRSCDTLVDLKILRLHLNELFINLCSNQDREA